MGKRWRVTEVAKERGELGGVRIGGDELQQHRVAVRGLVGHAANQMLWSYLGFSLELHLSQRGKEEETGLVEEGEDRDAGDDQEPDPQHQVDLLVDDVDREGAHPGVVDWVATWANVDHRALDDLGEDLGEGLVDELQGEEVVAEAEVLVAEDQVHGVHLSHSQYQARYLAEEQLESTGIKPATVREQKVSETSNLIGDRGLGERVLRDLGQELAHSASLHAFPDPPWQVAGTGLDC